MQVAAAVKEIDSYISDVPASCTNINTIAGTLDGATDSLLDAAKAFGFSALMDDECVRPFLVGLANPEITQVLLSDFEVGDFLE